jgi:hypothetical protein
MGIEDYSSDKPGLLTGALVGRRPALQVIESTSADAQISGQHSLPVYIPGT